MLPITPNENFVYIPVPADRYHDVLRYISSPRKQRRTMTHRPAESSDGRGPTSDSEVSDWRAPKAEKPKRIPKSNVFKPDPRANAAIEELREKVHTLKHELNIAHKSLEVSDKSNRQLHKQVEEARKHQAKADQSAAQAINSIKREIVMTETRSLVAPQDTSFEDAFDLPTRPVPIQFQERQAIEPSQAMVLESDVPVEKVPSRSDPARRKRVAEGKRVLDGVRKHGYRKALSAKKLGEYLVSQANTKVSISVQDPKSIHAYKTVRVDVPYAEALAKRFRTCEEYLNWNSLTSLLDQYANRPLFDDLCIDDNICGKPLPK